MIVRAKSSLMLVGLLLILLPVLAVMQYRWIGEISAAERDRLESSLRIASERFAIDFDAEFLRLANALQIRDGFPKSGVPITERYQAWSETAVYPQLVRGIYALRLGIDNQAEFYEVNWVTRELQLASLPERLENLRDGLRPGAFNFGAGETLTIVTPILRSGRPFGAPRPEDIFSPRPEDFRRPGGRRGPGPERGPDRGPRQDRLDGPPAPGPVPGAIDGATIIDLDRAVILNELVPALAEKHFSSHDETAYRLAVVTQGDQPKVLYSSGGDWTLENIATPDAVVPLFGMSRLPGNGGRGRPQGLRTQGTLATEPWQLLVRHRAGSLERAVEQVRMRNLVTAFGILLILGAGLITVVISSQRAHTLGKLQVEFAAGVSHELRTPLAVIRSAAHNLRSGIVRDKEGVEEYAKIVQQEARRLSDMVEEVLLYSETQSGRKKYKLESIDVNEVVDRAIANLSLTIDFEQCDLSTHIDPDLPPVKADAAALTQCLQNLLSNAFKYGKRGSKPQILIATRKDPSAAEVGLSVTDHGPGIDDDDQRQLFEPFYRGKNVGANVPGNGLGLHLVKSIMQAQGGRVTFSPAPGGGAVFTLHIPIAS